jgi:hypothetical protein
MDKRQTERQACLDPIEWTYFNQNRFHDAVKRNDSRKGFYFESTVCPKINASILIKPSTCPKREAVIRCASSFRSLALAKVKWLRIIKADEDPLYGIGAEYFESTTAPFF